MLDIFNSNILPQTFFIPLTCDNKSLYVDFMDELIKYLNREVVFKIDRDTLREIAKDFLLNNQTKYDKEISDENIGDHALNLVNVYINNGWIEEEIDKFGKRFLIIKPECINLFTFLNETKKIRSQFLTSSISGIRNNIVSNNIDYALLIKIKDDTAQLNNDLKNLQSGFKNLIKEFVKNNKNIDALTNYIIEGFYSRCFKDYIKLKTQENFKKLKEEIIDGLYSLYNDGNNILTTIVKNYIKDYESSEIDNEEKFYFIYNETRQLIDNVSSFFLYDYEEILQSIEFEQSKYTRIAVEQIKNIRGTDFDQLGKIKSLITFATKHDIDLSELIYINETKILDPNSLREYSTKERYKVVDYVKEDNISEAERRVITQQIKDECESPYTMTKILEIIDFYMENKEELIISDIEVRSRQELTILGIIPIYVSSSEIYEIIKLKNKHITKYGEIGNYKIKRK